jgi:hypothetical protein
MPSGLAQFVKSQGQDITDSPIEKDLARRRNIAANAKVQPAIFYKTAPAQSQSLQHRRTNPPVSSYVQPSRSQEQNIGDMFAGSVLSDSDDTTRDLGSSNIRGYQATLSPQFSQKIGGRNGIEQHSPPRYQGEFGDDEEEHDYGDEEEVLGDEPSDEYGHSRIINFPINSGQIKDDLLEQAIRLRDSPHFAEAEKLHNSKYGLSHLPPVNPGISGRFTATKNSLIDSHKNPNGFNNTAEGDYKSHLQRNDQLVSEDVPGIESDDHMGQANPQPKRLKPDGQPESTNQARIAIENQFKGEGQVQDRFPASESEYSGGSSEPSPLQHTPRANGQLRKQTPTLSQMNKRKKAALELDYDTDTLSTMKYSELKDQMFDSNPKAPASVIPEFLRSPEASIEDYLEHFKDSEPSGQSSFFAQMAMDEWERSGDWFLGQFGDIMSKLKDARRAKREVSRAFEEELASREEAVRYKSESIQEVFRQMRAGGEGVLTGRTP